jgi:hypothetical protein
MKKFIENNFVIIVIGNLLNNKNRLRKKNKLI